MKMISSVALLLVANSAIAGSVVKLESLDHNSNPPLSGTVEVSVEGNALRLEGSTPGTEESGSLIYKGGIEELTAIDHQSKQYYVIDQETMEQMIGQVSGAMQQMEAALAELPPEQRAMAERMMKQRMPQMQPEVQLQTLQKTGETETINGYECEIYDVMESGRKTRDMCVAPWDSIEGGAEFAEVMVEMADFFEAMRKGFSKGGADLMGSRSEVFSHMRDINGFPVRSRGYNKAGKLANESVLISSEKRNIDPAIFAPPAGYQQSSLN
jgi:hypothetical protein